MGISVLEAMLVGLLMELDCCSQKSPKSDDAQQEIQLEVACHRKVAAADGTSEVKAEKSFLPLVGPNVHELLKLILQEVKAARQQGKVKDGERKPGFCKKLALIIDWIFFVLYFLTVITFLTYMYFEWIKKVI